MADKAYLAIPKATYVVLGFPTRDMDDLCIGDTTDDYDTALQWAERYCGPNGLSEVSCMVTDGVDTWEAWTMHFDAVTKQRWAMLDNVRVDVVSFRSAVGQ